MKTCALLFVLADCADVDAPPPLPRCEDVCTSVSQPAPPLCEGASPVCTCTVVGGRWIECVRDEED